MQAIGWRAFVVGAARLAKSIAHFQAKWTPVRVKKMRSFKN
jgi:hypothetical protein